MNEVLLVDPSLSAGCMCCNKPARVAWRTGTIVAPYLYYCLHCWRWIDGEYRAAQSQNVRLRTRG